MKIITKSIVVAGAFALVGVIGGQMSEAAGPGAIHVHQNTAVHVKKHKMNPSQANKVHSMAAEHASAEAKQHASDHSAVKAAGSSLTAGQTVNNKKQHSELKVHAKRQSHPNPSLKNKVHSMAAEHASDQAKQHASTHSAVKATGDSSTVQQTANEDAASKMTETKGNINGFKKAKKNPDHQNPSLKNKVHSMAAEHASDQAKRHAAPNSAVRGTATMTNGQTAVKGNDQSTVKQQQNKKTANQVVVGAGDSNQGTGIDQKQNVNKANQAGSVDLSWNDKIKSRVNDFAMEVPEFLDSKVKTWFESAHTDFNSFDLQDK